MMTCSFCSQHSQMLFSHMIHDIGLLCMECYLKFHGCCGSCGTSFLPKEIEPNANYQVRAKFIGAGDRHYVVCDKCFHLIRNEFSEFFAN